MNPTLHNIIAQNLKIPEGSLHFELVGGGSINETGRLTADGQNFFYKINNASKFPHLFQKEANALRYISSQKIIKAPGVLHCIETESEQVLILEWIKSGTKTHQFWKSFGSQLAALHSITNSHFGWEEQNYMGSIEQSNPWTEDWSSFFASQRLMPLAERCLQANLLTVKHHQKLEKVCDQLSAVFEPEPPALLHGDLWSGNFMCNDNEEPVLIDPAIYFGHRSIDLAMTTLFGGFDKAFYEAYHYYLPLPNNYQEQWKICNLYPLLIHLYLFGSSYRPQIEQTLSNFPV
ncbi:fructosamine kinase family protein [Chitinophagaceae bacterium LB-8]|uniref:Fructosamine kinase family protein n=1 Tax=Paraflavisolibacter caeni TaxID=2982496 RepID=A0A9X3B6L6_9BACT|nr:fructosamine kinase family protein [Paraflavisolibacter caeni]MCU7548225.1 fructosamine kinase family protein [Paraflavisolibacter caeni]